MAPQDSDSEFKGSCENHKVQLHHVLLCLSARNYSADNLSHVIAIAIAIAIRGCTRGATNDLYRARE